MTYNAHEAKTERKRAHLCVTIVCFGKKQERNRTWHVHHLRTGSEKHATLGA